MLYGSNQDVGTVQVAGQRWQLRPEKDIFAPAASPTINRPAPFERASPTKACSNVWQRDSARGKRGGNGQGAPENSSLETMKAFEFK